MFNSKTTYPLSIELTFDLQNIGEFMESNIELPEYDLRKFSEIKESDIKDTGSVLDKYTPRDLTATYRVDVLPGPTQNVDIFYHVTPAIHASVFDANIYTAVDKKLSDYQNNYCSRRGIDIFRWSLGHKGEVYVIVGNRIALVTPSMAEKISILRRKGYFSKDDELKQQGPMRRPEDIQYEVKFNSDSRPCKVWGGVSKNDFAYHNGMVHLRVTRICDTIQYDTSRDIM